MEQCGQELNSFEEIIEKTVDAKAKATFRPRSYACKTDQHYIRGSWPFAAKANTQSQLVKDPKVKEPKSRTQKLKVPALQCSNSAKTSKQAQKEKKKKDK